MTPAETREAIASLPLTQKEIAEKIGVSHGHLRNVLSGQKPLGRAPTMLLRQLMKARGRWHETQAPRTAEVQKGNTMTEGQWTREQCREWVDAMFSKHQDSPAYVAFDLIFDEAPMSAHGTLVALLLQRIYAARLGSNP